MTDRQTIIISWFFAALSVPAFVWNVDAGMIVGAIAAVLRWNEISSFDKTIGKSKEPYWICSFVYWVLLSVSLLILKLTGISGSHLTSDSDFKYLMLLMLLPFVPRMIKYDYNQFIQLGTEK